MVFKKGQSGNANGRPKGSRTVAIDIIFKIFNDNKKTFTEEMQKLYRKNPVGFYLKFLAPLQPKNIKLSGDEDNPIQIAKRLFDE